ncbi:4-hydroxybenzoate octaprenyltransferase [Methylicorpusculum sp.]|uniref:4-hydroxybenzoate octaprenyltransferase n=1 Tax=Methylicorpusculum sp. TaxID=2713644 RepID=UPI002720EAF6|nr:4-hydroxybenzoate octaprenyltransferase [Methylicorpusculum sp.]MDO8844469.1 4-hydroxybenzoate octaprenyltransferase [Methylicorpusculum sp.]
MNSQQIQERAKQYWLLARLDRPIGIYILLWPALWALWLASEGSPNLTILFVFCAGVVLMRSAGCVINDYADRDFDPHVERTRQRPIAAGKVSTKEALIIFVVLSLCAFALVLLLNTLTIALSFGGAFLAASYPFMKRYTHLPQAYLGIAFGWAVPMAYAAETDAIPLTAWVLYIAVILWALVYDTMYAMVDKEDDLKIGVKSTAILFGDKDREIMGGLQLLIMSLLLTVGYLQGMGWLYYAGLCSGAGFFIYQQQLIFKREKSQCFKAFLNNNWFGLVVFIGIVLDYWVR